ncbi:MAG: DUF1273 domain-containing protein [Eubacteriales bacterium]|nr:DUF1273 domain-containing protein [Eubacteriales bacterium]
MDYQILFKTEMNIPSTCVLAGHSPDVMPWNCSSSSGAVKMKNTLIPLLEKLVTQKGVTHFMCGMSRGAALLEASCVLQMKKKYPQISLQCVVPDKEFTSLWSASDKAAFRRIISKADSVMAMTDVPVRYGRRTRREYMVDCSGYLVCIYVPGSPGPCADMIEYAAGMGRGVIMIDPSSYRIYCYRSSAGSFAGPNRLDKAK